MSKQDLQKQLVEAMKAQDEVKKSTLRMLISAISYYEIQKGGAGYTATDEDVLQVVSSEVKKHKDSIEQYKNANRQDLVDKETAELKVLEQFMPEQMSEDEIRTLVDQTISETAASSPTDMGKVMGALMPKTKGKADGSLVSKIVKERLLK